MILDLTTTKYSIIMCKEDEERGEEKMYLAGMQKLSLLDFPGVVACTLFTPGCNFRCPWCHNASLVLPEQFPKELPYFYHISFFTASGSSVMSIIRAS